MRYVDLELTPADGSVHPVDDRLAAAGGVAREALLQVDSYCDGTAALLYRLRGDPAAARAVVEAAAAVRRHEVVTGNRGVHLFVHLSAVESGGPLLELVRDHPVLVDTPVVFTDEAVVVTLFGAQRWLQRALAAIPEAVGVSVRRAGRYGHGDPDVVSLLTRRQREVFEHAVEAGYYDLPRRTDQAELADALGIAPSTLDEHLRRAESTMLSALLNSPASGADRAGEE